MALENAAQCDSDTIDDQLFHVSGVTLNIDPQAPVGSRLGVLAMCLALGDRPRSMDGESARLAYGSCS